MGMEKINNENEFAKISEEGIIFACKAIYGIECLGRQNKSNQILFFTTKHSSPTIYQMKMQEVLL